MRPLNSTLAGRVLIRLVILWGGVYAMAWLFFATPVGGFAPFLVPIMLFGLWVAAIKFSSKPTGPGDQSEEPPQVD